MYSAQQHLKSGGATTLLSAASLFGFLLATPVASQVGLPPVEPTADPPPQAAPETLGTSDEASAEAAKETKLPPRFGVHQENYFLLLSDVDGLNAMDSGIRNLDDVEIKFQLSLRYRLVRLGRGAHRGDLVFAYTNSSFWQLYNTEESAPFRTTDHEPELFYEWPAGPVAGGTPLKMYRLGVVHESNGEGPRLSRSWNRLYGEYLYASNSLACRPGTRSSRPRPGACLAFKAWWIFEHDEIRNPDIEDYKGNFELRAERVWERCGNTRLSIVLRNNLRSSDNRGAVQLDLSFAVYRGTDDDLRLRLQYFEGYGESLIDYDHDVRRFGIGFEFTY